MTRFPLLRPLVFFALPPRLAVIVPTILRQNREIVRDRVAGRNKLAHPDYFSLMVHDEQQPSEDFLLAQANHLIIAGFDPNSNLFTSGVHYLLTNPTKLDKLQQEVRTHFANYRDMDGDSLEDLPWLNAVIQESLRMHTNGAFGLPRFSPGAFVDGHWVPKGSVHFHSRAPKPLPIRGADYRVSFTENSMRVQTSIFATSHSERYFRQPRDFCPERWLPTSHPDYNPVFDSDSKSSFKPFSVSILHISIFTPSRRGIPYLRHVPPGFSQAAY